MRWDGYKTCTKCSVRKYREEFHRDKRHPADKLSGWRAICKDCFNARVRAATEAEPEKFKARARAYYAAHRQERIAYVARWQNENREKVRMTRALHRHGSENVLAGLLVKQDGRCYLCGREMSIPESGSVGVRHHTATVDHDHDCPVGHDERYYTCEVCRRGAACSRCNMLISFGEENPDLLRFIAGNLERALASTAERKAQYVTPTCFCENCGDEITYHGKGQWPKKFCSRRCNERKRTERRRLERELVRGLVQ